MGMVRAILSSISVPEATSCISGSGIDSESPIKQEWQKKKKKKTLFLLHLFDSRHCAECFMYIVLSKKHRQSQLQESSASASAPNTAPMYMLWSVWEVSMERHSQ